MAIQTSYRMGGQRMTIDPGCNSDTCGRQAGAGQGQPFIWDGTTMVLISGFQDYDRCWQAMCEVSGKGWAWSQHVMLVLDATPIALGEYPSWHQADAVARRLAAAGVAVKVVSVVIDQTRSAGVTETME